MMNDFDDNIDVSPLPTPLQDDNLRVLWSSDKKEIKENIDSNNNTNDVNKQNTFQYITNDSSKMKELLDFSPEVKKLFDSDINYNINVTDGVYYNHLESNAIKKIDFDEINSSDVNKAIKSYNISNSATNIKSNYFGSSFGCCVNNYNNEIDLPKDNNFNKLAKTNSLKDILTNYSTSWCLTDGPPNFTNSVDIKVKSLLASSQSDNKRKSIDNSDLIANFDNKRLKIESKDNIDILNYFDNFINASYNNKIDNVDIDQLNQSILTQINDEKIKLNELKDKIFNNII